ncbi:MAG: hypothetical protein V1495_04015 [Pseudomonadota bacterium]
MGKGPNSFNFVGFFLVVLSIAGFYLCYKYVPVVWNKQKLEDAVKEISYSAARSEDDQLRKTLIETAHNDMEIDLQEGDIEITRFSERIRIRVTWRPTVRFLGVWSLQHAWNVVVTTTFY